MLSPEKIDIRAVLAAYLRERFPALNDGPIEDATPLLADNAIDSLGILDLATFLGERFGVEITDEDFEPANFETFGRLVTFVERRQS